MSDPNDSIAPKPGNESAPADSVQRMVVARCRWCDRNDRPLEAMAIYSYKHSYGGFTGVCKDCINDPAAEVRYHQRMDARHNVGTQRPGTPSATDSKETHGPGSLE